MNLDWIWDKTREISGQADAYSPRKKSNSFTHKRTFLSALAVMNKKFIANPVGRIWPQKSQPKLNRHSDECLVKIWDRNTQKVRRSRSQTESEQNWFSENKTSLLFLPVSSFCDLFMDVPSYMGANNVWNFFNAIRTQNKIAKSMAKFHKFR